MKEKRDFNIKDRLGMGKDDNLIGKNSFSFKILKKYWNAKVIKMTLNLHKVKPGRGPAVEVFRAKEVEPTRYRYKHESVMHKGKEMEERLGFRGHKVVEVAFVPKK